MNAVVIFYWIMSYNVQLYMHEHVFCIHARLFTIWCSDVIPCHKSVLVSAHIGGMAEGQKTARIKTGMYIYSVRYCNLHAYHVVHIRHVYMCIVPIRIPSLASSLLMGYACLQAYWCLNLVPNQHDVSFLEWHCSSATQKGCGCSPWFASPD